MFANASRHTCVLAAFSVSSAPKMWVKTRCFCAPNKVDVPTYRQCESVAAEPSAWVLKDLRKTCATYYDEHMPESSIEILGHSVSGVTYRANQRGQSESKGSANQRGQRIKGVRPLR